MHLENDCITVQGMVILKAKAHILQCSLDKALLLCSSHHVRAPANLL